MECSLLSKEHKAGSQFSAKPANVRHHSIKQAQKVEALKDKTMNDAKSPQSDHALPAQKAMKQTSKTSSERGEGPNDAPGEPEPSQPMRKGNAGVGTTENEGSSPYSDRARKEKPQRDE